MQTKLALFTIQALRTYPAYKKQAEAV